MDCDEAASSSVRRPRLIADFHPRKSQAVRLARQAVLESLRAQGTSSQLSQPAQTDLPVQPAQPVQNSEAVQLSPQARPLVLVAVSGGRDSLALLAVTVLAARELNWRVAAICVDHHMQPGSTQVARNTRQVALGLGCEHAEIISINVDPRRGGPEAAARTARYRVIAAHAQQIQASAVLLAHTLDDQAETVLLGLLRSAGPDALVGMPPAIVRHDVTFLRPLLHITRAQTTAICEAFGIQWWDDPTNGDALTQRKLEEEPSEAACKTSASCRSSAASVSDLPLRSQIRQRLIPLMKKLGGEAVSEHLASVAQHEQAVRTSLERRVDELERRYVRQLQRTDNLEQYESHEQGSNPSSEPTTRPNSGPSPSTEILELPVAVLTDDEVLGSRLVMRVLKRANVEPNREKVRQVLNLASKPTLNTELHLRDRRGEVVSFMRVKTKESESLRTSPQATTALLIEFHRNTTFR